MNWTEIADIAIKICLPITVVVFGWLLNERSKRQLEERRGRTERYVALIKSLKGFYVDTSLTAAERRKEKEAFIEQLSLCWLYCPDEVINKGYDFLGHVHVGVEKSKEDKEQALGLFVLEVRKDLLRKKTKLGARNFRILSATSDRSQDAANTQG